MRSPFEVCGLAPALSTLLVESRRPTAGPSTTEGHSAGCLLPILVLASLLGVPIVHLVVLGGWGGGGGGGGSSGSRPRCSPGPGAAQRSNSRRSRQRGGSGSRRRSRRRRDNRSRRRSRQRGGSGSRRRSRRRSDNRSRRRSNGQGGSGGLGFLLGHEADPRVVAFVVGPRNALEQRGVHGVLRSHGAIDCAIGFHIARDCRVPIPLACLPNDLVNLPHHGSGSLVVRSTARLVIVIFGVVDELELEYLA